jgi:ASCH domain
MRARPASLTSIDTSAPGFALPDAGLLIRAPFIDWILDGLKIWEIRTKRTTRRGRIGLIRSASGLVVGEATLVEVVGPLTHRQLLQNADKMHAERKDLAAPDVPTFAWVLEHAKRYEPPVPYVHRPGAVIWVRLP